MRGILALCVVLLHFGFNGVFTRITGVDGFVFQLSVDFFFILSGFVLAHAHARRRRGLAVFAVQRVFRLLPVHCATLALMLVAIGGDVEAWYLALELLVLSPLATPLPLNIAAWSVTWELYLPLLALVVLQWRGPLRLPPRAVLVALGAAMAVACWHVARDADLYAVRAALGLAAGAMLAERPPARARPAWQIYALLVAMLAVMLAAGSFAHAALFFSGVAIAAVAVGTQTVSLLSSPPLQWLGRISFTLYMAHMPVLSLMRAWSAETVDGSPLAKLAGILLSLALAALLTTAVENPMIRLGRRLTDPRRRPDPAPAPA